MHPFIMTASGEDFWFLNPAPETILIEDIAAALSKICRYTGHCRHFYSVAQHSVIVSHLVPEEQALEGLLHDASEAYLGDMSAPLKRQLPEYQEIEGIVESAIAKKFGLMYNLDLGWPSAVKRADIQVLALEKKLLLPESKTPWGILDGVECPDEKLLHHCWQPVVAELRFLQRFVELTSAAAATRDEPVGQAG